VELNSHCYSLYVSGKQLSPPHQATTPLIFTSSAQRIKLGTKLKLFQSPHQHDHGAGKRHRAKQHPHPPSPPPRYLQQLTLKQVLPSAFGSAASSQHLLITLSSQHGHLDTNQRAAPKKASVLQDSHLLLSSAPASGRGKAFENPGHPGKGSSSQSG